MELKQRYEKLGHLRSTTKADKYGVTFQLPFLKGDEVLYAIPEHIVDAISDAQLDIFSSEEIELEKFFAQLCRRVGIVGFACGRVVRYPLLEPINRKTPGLHERFEAHQRVMQFANRVIDQFNVPRLAFLGWLTKHSPYQKDRLRLLRKWRKHGSNPNYLTGRNHLRQYGSMPAQMQYGSGLNPELCNDFLAFYRKWDLNGMTTWDLPLQLEPNLGGPGQLGALMEMNHNPAIQLPSSMRLPSKLPLQKLLEQQPLDHLAPWRKILQRKQTKRWAEGFVIHFYQKVVLKRIFGKELDRCQRKLDEILEQAFRVEAPIKAMKKMRVDSIKKVRLAYQNQR